MISHTQHQTETSSNSTMEGALVMYRLGFKIFPVWGVVNGVCQCKRGTECQNTGKHPVEKNWQNSQTLANEVLIRQYWQSSPNTNYGVNTEGYAVIDIDDRKGGYKNYLQHLKPIIDIHPSFTVQTGSGGNSFHIYYRTSKDIRNSTKLFDGIDVRAAGGLAVGLGCNHKSGGAYKMHYSGTDNTDVINVAVLPIEIEQILFERQTKAFSKDMSNSDAKAILAFGADIPDGLRNTTVFTKGCQLRQQGLAIEEIRLILKELNAAKCDPPMKDHEIETILGSINKYKAGGTAIWSDPDLNYNLKDPVLPDIEDRDLPQVLRNYILTKSRSLGIPKSAILVSAMTHFSALLGTVYKVTPKLGNDYSVSLNLWGLIVAVPSSRKTAALEIFMKPLEQVQEFFIQKRNSFVSQKRENAAKLNAEKENLKQSISKEKNNEELKNKLSELEVELAKLKDAPIPYWIFKTSDSTPEALAISFKDNSRGILFFRDEMQGLFGMLAKQGYENLRSLLTEAWNGNKPYTINRIERGLISIPSMTLSVLGSVQPDVLYSTFSDELMKGKGGDGFVQRFQLISQYSLSQVNEPDDTVSMTGDQFFMSALINAIHTLTKEKNLEPNMQPVYLTLSHDAHKKYKEYRNHLNSLIRREDITNSAYLAHLGKLDRLVLSLAGQLHILNNVNVLGPIKNEIVFECVDEAIQVAKYMESQIFHLYFKVGKNLHAKALLAKIKSKEIRDGMSIRSIYKHGWSYLKNSDDMLAAIEEISDSNWVQVVNETPKGGGQPTNILKINPKLIEFLNSKSGEDDE